MLASLNPVIAYGCNCGGSGAAKQSGSQNIPAGATPSGPAAPGFTSTKRPAASTFSGPARRRPTAPPTQQ